VNMSNPLLGPFRRKGSKKAKEKPGWDDPLQVWCLVGEICPSFPHRVCVECIMLLGFVAYFNWLVQGMAGVSKWSIARSKP
jgi:hypothetical protein